MNKYEKALSLIFAEPQEENNAEKKSVNMLLAMIAKLRFDPGPPACEKFCRQEFGNRVHVAMAYMHIQFQGLCLDCINRSTPKSDNVDLDFWILDSVPPSDGVGKCRLQHLEPTRYFSYMGPEEARDRFFKWMDDAADERISKEADEEENDEEEDDPENDDENDEGDDDENDDEADGDYIDENSDDDEMN